MLKNIITVSPYRPSNIFLITAWLLSVPLFGQSPGGVNTNLNFWVKADMGATTSSWTDQTGSADLAGSSILNDGSSASAINYNPVQSFTSGAQQMLTTMGALTESDILEGADHFTSYLMVFRYNSGITPLIRYSSPSGNYGIGIHSNGNLFCDGNSFSIGAYNSGDLYLTGLLGNQTTADYVFNNDNTVTPVSYTNTAPFSGDQLLRVGGGAGVDIGEILIYNRWLNDTEAARVQSYLAIKYGIHLTSFLAGSTSYLSSSGSSIYDASSYSGEIIGIGRDDGSGLIQKQSRQQDDVTKLYISTLAGSNALNSGSFSANESFIIMGNDEGSLNYGSTEFPAGLSLDTRINREWKINNTNFNGTFSIDITLSESPGPEANLRVLIDDDGDFSSGTTEVISTGITVSGNTVTISGISTTNIPANSVRYLSLASTDITLPVELVSFDVKLKGDNAVELSWVTATEINNDYFDVQRSVDGTHWEHLVDIEGAGNSSTITYYSTFDNNPFKGKSYYRLKQIDKDGRYSYSAIKGLYIEKTKRSQLSFFPNPTFGQITVSSDGINKEKIAIYDMVGNNITEKILILNGIGGNVIMDLSTLNNGLYLISSGEASQIVYKIE